MNKLFFDIESTGINSYTAEIIEAYFKLFDSDDNFIDDYHFTSRVNNWSSEAEAIHKISKSTMLSYPDKKSSFDNLNHWLSGGGSYECYLYANPNTPLGHIYFDVAILQMEFMNHLNVNNLFDQPFQPQKINSVYTQSKKMQEYFTPILYKDAYSLGLTTKKEHAHSNTKCFTQAGVYYALFSDVYNSHNCVDDTNALYRIYDRLSYLELNALKNQMELI